MGTDLEPGTQPAVGIDDPSGTDDQSALPRSGAAPCAPGPEDRIVFFDGVCVLCNSSVDALLRADREGRFRVASLQGETAARAQAADPAFPRDLATIVLWDRGALYVRSRAILRVASELPYPYRALGWFRILPAFLTDLVYRLVARTRYQIFGKREICRVPSPDERQRFLD